MIPCFHINKIAFLLKPLNFADSHYFNHKLISGITVYGTEQNYTTELNPILCVFKLHTRLRTEYQPIPYAVNQEVLNVEKFSYTNYTGYFCQGGIRFMYVILNMYSLLCFPLVLLLSFIWQWFKKSKKKIYIYTLMFSVHVVIKFRGGGICQGGYLGGSPSV